MFYGADDYSRAQFQVSRPNRQLAQALEGDEGIIVQVGQRSAGLFSDEPVDPELRSQVWESVERTIFCMRCGSSVTAERAVNE